MDYIQMCLWADDLYQSGYAKGVKAVGALTKKELIEVLRSRKGFDIKRAQEVVAALEAAMAEKQSKGIEIKGNK